MKDWLKIQRMTEDRYPYKAYKMTIVIVNTHNSSVVKIRRILIKYVFENAWNDQVLQRTFPSACYGSFIVDAVVQLLASCNEAVLQNVALYICYASRRRREAAQMDAQL